MPKKFGQCYIKIFDIAKDVTSNGQESSSGDSPSSKAHQIVTTFYLNISSSKIIAIIILLSLVICENGKL